MTHLRDTLEQRIGHDVGWDLTDCPQCGPIPPDDTDNHRLTCDVKAAQ